MALGFEERLKQEFHDLKNLLYVQHKVNNIFGFNIYITLNVFTKAVVGYHHD